MQDTSACILSCVNVDANVHRWLSFVRPVFDEVYVQSVSKTDEEDLEDGFGTLNFASGPRPWEDFSHAHQFWHDQSKSPHKSWSRMAFVDANYLRLIDIESRHDLDTFWQARDCHVWSLTASETPSQHLQRGLFVMEDAMSLAAFRKFCTALSGPAVRGPHDQAHRFELPCSQFFQKRLFRLQSVYSGSNVEKGPLSGAVQPGANVSQAHWDSLLMAGCPMVIQNRKRQALEQSFLKDYHLV